MNTTIKNDCGISNARIGILSGGKRGVFTHRNPLTGEIWCEQIEGNKFFKGGWFSSNYVKLI